MTRPRLSVILPNYNHGRYLPRCLQSILDQSWPADEIIVVDDGSDDDSVEIIESFARRYSNIRFYRNTQNMGVVAAIDRAFSLVTCDFVFGAAADDQILPGLFEKSLRLLAEYPQAALSCTIGDYREAATGLNWYMGVGMGTTPCFLTPARMVEIEKQGSFYIPPNSAILRKSALIEAGMFIPDLKYACDWFAMYVAGFRHGICFVPEPLAVFHVLPDSYYQRMRRDKVANLQVVRNLLDYLSRPEYRDAAELIRESGALYLFGWPMLKAMMSDPQYRSFLNPIFLRKNVWHILRLEVKKITPRFAAQWYLRVAGYRPRSEKTGEAGALVP